MSKFYKYTTNYILLIIFFAFTGCSKIWYWDDNNNLNNITNERQEEQISNIKNSNPICDSTISHLIFDNRLVAETNGMSIFTGVKDLDLINELGTKNIWGNTDVDSNDYLSCWAAKYAVEYNYNLLKKLGKESFFVGLSDRQKDIIKNRIGIEIK